MTDAEGKRVIRAIGHITSVNEIDLGARNALEQLQGKLQKAVDELNKLEITNEDESLRGLSVEIAKELLRANCPFYSTMPTSLAKHAHEIAVALRTYGKTDKK